MPDTQCSQIFLGRQPILGREQQLLAYELLFREGPIFTSNRAEIIDPSQATATVIANAFTELSANETLGPYRGYINVDQEFLFNDLIEALPPKVVVLEILETVRPTPDVIARCRQLCEKGFSLAIDDVVDVIDEEHEDDIMRLGGVREDDLYSASIETAQSRFTWLLVNLGTAILASAVFLTTVTDVVGFFAFLGLGAWLLL